MTYSQAFFFINSGFAFGLDIPFNMKPAQQVCTLGEHSFHCIHQCQVFASHNNYREAIIYPLDMQILQRMSSPLVSPQQSDLVGV